MIIGTFLFFAYLYKGHNVVYSTHTESGLKPSSSLLNTFTISLSLYSYEAPSQKRGLIILFKFFSNLLLKDKFFENLYGIGKISIPSFFETSSTLTSSRGDTFAITRIS